MRFEIRQEIDWNFHYGRDNSKYLSEWNDKESEPLRTKEETFVMEIGRVRWMACFRFVWLCHHRGRRVNNKLLLHFFERSRIEEDEICFCLKGNFFSARPTNPSVCSLNEWNTNFSLSSTHKHPTLPSFNPPRTEY